MEPNVTSLETSKKLKEAGFPDETTIYRWWLGLEAKLFTESEWMDYADEAGGLGGEFFAAPTAQELADQLPDFSVVKTREGGRYGVVYGEHILPADPLAATMAEALAALYLKLHAPRQLSQGDGK